MLNIRDVEGVMAERDIVVSRETVRRRVTKLEALIAPICAVALNGQRSLASG